MVFKGRDTVRSKIVINNNIIEQINTFSYPGCSISYQSEKDVTGKISKFLHITGIIDRILKSSQVQKYTRLKICKILVLPTLLYGRETWAMKEQDKSGTSAEMKFMRRTPEYIWKSYKTNEDILLELKINPVVKEIQNYRKKWIQHIWRWADLLTLFMDQSPS